VHGVAHSCLTLGKFVQPGMIPHMVKVQLARHLIRFFPQLDGKMIEVQADNAAQVVAELEGIAPGIAFYICDERGSLRPHVNIFIENELIADRRRLTDKVRPGSRVHILQALSGG
jgi:sulfur-carrier protein